MHFSVLKIQFQAFFENSKSIMRKVEDIMHTVKVWDFLFFKQCFVLSKTVLSLQEIGAVSIETLH